MRTTHKQHKTMMTIKTINQVLLLFLGGVVV